MDSLSCGVLVIFLILMGILFQDQCQSTKLIPASAGEEGQTGIEFFPIEIPKDGSDVWEIDTKQLKTSEKVASGSFGDL